MISDRHDQDVSLLLQAGGPAAVVPTEYLVSYGNAGAFGRFRPKTHLTCRRGDAVVVQTHRGLELGSVLCAARPGHAHHLPNTSVGQLVRLANQQDQAVQQALRNKECDILVNARRLVDESSMPVEIIDVEILLDGQHAALLYLEMQAWDPRPMVSTLARVHSLHILLESLSRQSKEVNEEDLPDSEGGCGKPNCGQTEGGGCSTCGTGGGCSTCGSSSESDVKEYFSELREKMHDRVPLN